MAQYIYTMIGVSKIVPPNRTIIKNLTPALRELSEAACTSPTQMEFQNHLIKA